MNYIPVLYLIRSTHATKRRCVSIVNVSPVTEQLVLTSILELPPKPASLDDVDPVPKSVSMLYSRLSNYIHDELFIHPRWLPISLRNFVMLTMSSFNKDLQNNPRVLKFSFFQKLQKCDRSIRRTTRNSRPTLHIIPQENPQ